MGSLKRYEFVDGGASKFWEVAVVGSELRLAYGRIGAKGQLSVKVFASPAAAQKEADKRAAKKTSKGYVLTASGGAPTASEAPAVPAADPSKAAAARGADARADATDRRLSRPLTQKQYLATFDHPMRLLGPDDDLKAVSLTEYIEHAIAREELPTTREEIGIDGVFVGKKSPLVHVVFGWGERARRLAVVTDPESDSVVGDYSFDMDADASLYQLPSTGVLTPKTAMKVLNDNPSFGVTRSKTSNGTQGYRVRVNDRSVLPHDLLAALGNVVALEMQPKNTADLEEVLANPALAQLEKLSLQEMKRTTTIDAIAGFRTLKELKLVSVVDISPVMHLTSLEKLELERCPTETLEPLSALTKLTNLRLHWCRKVKSFDVIKSHPSLEKLRVSYCGKLKDSDIKSLEQLVRATAPKKKKKKKKKKKSSKRAKK